MTLLDLTYEAMFARTDGDQSVNRHLGEFMFNVFLGSRWWITPAFGQLFNDRFQNIRFRATPAAGAGVHIFDMPNAKWDFQTGLGYQFLNYKDVSALTPGVSNPQNDVFVPLYTWWDFNITGDIDLTMSRLYQPGRHHDWQHQPYCQGRPRHRAHQCTGPRRRIPLPKD